MQKALSLNPSLASAHFGIAIARLMQGDATGALVAARAEPGEAYSLTAIAIAMHRLGDAAGSDAALSRLLGEYGDSRYQIAEVHAQRGETAEALALLDTALTTLDSGFLWAPNDPLLDPLRGDPTFKDLLIRFAS